MRPIEIFRTLRAGLASRALLFGVALGFAVMCLLGHRVSRVDYHQNFLRFTQWVSPESKYYPTIDEMAAIVRHRARPDQILVIVGGNSVMRGVGQPPDHLWSKRLQEHLGDGYCVINFAFNSSLPTDGAAVLAESLRKEYPRQIYLANAAPTQGAFPAGSDVYRFVFWGAQAKGLLSDDPVRAAAMKKVDENPAWAFYQVGLLELKIRSWLDRFLFFQDFWNYMTYDKFGTVWGFYLPGAAGFQAPLSFLDPRKIYADPEPDFLAMPMSIRYPSSSLDAELINVRGCSEYAFYTKDAQGHWLIYQPVWDLFRDFIAGEFPQELKKRTLILMSHSSPYYIQRLPADEQLRDRLAYAESVREWKAGGYDSIEYGQDYTVDDYGDRTHLTWHGGEKLARTVADKIREMSQNLGYLHP